MRKTGHITFGAVLAALAVVVMLMSYFPYLTYSIPALAGMFIMVAVIELGNKWALFSYVVSAFLSVLFAEPEAAFLYVFLFGSYPIIKVLIENQEYYYAKPGTIGKNMGVTVLDIIDKDVNDYE